MPYSSKVLDECVTCDVTPAFALASSRFPPSLDPVGTRYYTAIHITAAPIK